MLRDSDVPALLGRASLRRLRALIDCHNDVIYFLGGDGEYELRPSSAQTTMHQLEESVSGHSMLPITEYAKVKKKNEKGPRMVYEYQDVKGNRADTSSTKP